MKDYKDKKLDEKVKELQFYILEEISRPDILEFPNVNECLKKLKEIEEINERYGTNYMSNHLFGLKKFDKEKLPLREINYKLELIVIEPMATKGEIKFEGRTNNPDLALSTYLVLSNHLDDYMSGRVNHTLKIYRGNEEITKDVLLKDFREKHGFE